MINVTTEIYLDDVDDVREFLGKLDKTDVVASYRQLVEVVGRDRSDYYVRKQHTIFLCCFQ